MDNMANGNLDYNDKVKAVLFAIKGLLFFLSLFVASILGAVIAFKVSQIFGWLIVCLLICFWLTRINIK